ncbi:hypothetical protein [Streptomyces sp. VRA16 Mangrove soil]|uniref:hypothetical protein n=1 Tax=Streptomyces sp. VRA16 Mangrove soil TaxID=2817434 RepID=UPI001A9E6DB9|nr:hypothetical protein [Streptomyces sp. VRA16 Mangrove soil]MBO1334772.1 hypothetical protein [Streptomyces sp. VRA16 Mangrove soil]
MSRHSAPKSPSRARGSLLRVGLTVTAAGAVVAGGGGAASAAAPQDAGPAATSGDVSPGQAVSNALHSSTVGGLGVVKGLRLDPLAGTGVDPLDNAVGTQIADFKPVSTAAVTAPITSGGALKDLPVVGPATGVLPG